jgi:hypothetical protein
MTRQDQINRLKERTWQWEAKEAIDKALDENQKLFAINACVGSGKTNVAFEAMISFIEKFNPEKSVQVFICPRLSLCDQQLSEMKEYITTAGIKGNFVLLNSSNCNESFEHLSVKDGNLNPLSPENKHVFVVACDASIWGGKKVEAKIRFNRFKKFLENEKSLDRSIGVIAYDEAHNYKGNGDALKSEIDKLSKLFTISLFMSGTPAQYQFDIFKKTTNKALCSVATAGVNGWICKPTLNLVYDKDPDLSTKEIQLFKSEVEMIIKNETKRFEQYEGKYPRILICSNGIDPITDIKNKIEGVHVFAIHSYKQGNEKNKFVDATSTINGKKVTKETILSMLDALDNNDLDFRVEDSGNTFVAKDFLDKPLVVFQVDTISEGVNVKSFSAVYISTHSGQKQVQQIGRVLRNSNFPVNKNQNELAQVYVGVDNAYEVAELMLTLQEYSLGDETPWTSWLKLGDIYESSGAVNSDEPPEFRKTHAIEAQIDIETLFKMEFNNNKVFKNFDKVDLSDEELTDLQELWDFYSSKSHACSAGFSATSIKKQIDDKKAKSSVEKDEERDESRSEGETPKEAKDEESKNTNDEKTNKQSFKEMITYYIKQVQKNRVGENLNKYYNEDREGFISLIVEDEKIANLLTKVFAKRNIQC